MCFVVSDLSPASEIRGYRKLKLRFLDEAEYACTSLAKVAGQIGLTFSARRILACMQWRRGLIFAGINVLLAVPLIIWAEIRDAVYVREQFALIGSKTEKISSPIPSLSADPKAEGVSLDMCSAWIRYPRQIEIVRFTNMPASAFVGWRLVCPERWTLSGLLHADHFSPLTPSRLVAQKNVDVAFFLLIGLQWIFVGGLPLRHTRRWWAEPGLFITICGGTAAAVVFIPFMSGLASLLVLFAASAWLWWFGLSLIAAIRFSWNKIRRLGAAN